MVSELRARLGTRMADPQAIANEIARLRTEVHMAPAAWGRVERIALALGGHLASGTTHAPAPTTTAGRTDAGGQCIPPEPPSRPTRPALALVGCS